MLRITLPDEIDRLDELAEAVTDYSESAGIADHTILQLNLVVEELFVNFVSHGLAKQGQFELFIEHDDDSVRLTLKDNGRPFNPLEAPTPDTSAPIEDRGIGKLGLHLVRQIASECSYERETDRNVVRLTIPRNPET